MRTQRETPEKNKQSKTHNKRCQYKLSILLLWVGFMDKEGDFERKYQKNQQKGK